MLQRVVLLTRRGVDVADPLRVGLQVELMRRAEPLRDPRRGDQFPRRQSPAAHPALRALLWCAAQPSGLAEHRVQQIQAAGDVDRSLLEVLVGDLAESPVAAGKHKPHSEQGRAPLLLGADRPLHRGNVALQLIQDARQRMPGGQPAQPLRQPGTRQHRPAGTDRARQDQRRRAPGPVLRGPRPIDARVPARPPLGLDALPALLQRPAGCGSEDHDQRRRRMAHLTLALGAEGQRGDERLKPGRERRRVKRRVAQRRQVGGDVSHAARRRARAPKPPHPAHARSPGRNRTRTPPASPADRRRPRSARCGAPRDPPGR